MGKTTHPPATRAAVVSRKSARKARSRVGILESAARLLRCKGISGARVADVMKDAGLTVGGFYGHFPTKKALIDAALRQTLTELRQRLFKDLDDRPARARAELVFERYLSAAHRDHTSSGCPLPAVVGEIGTSAPEHRAVLVEQLVAMTSALADSLPATQSHEDVRARRKRALGLMALLFGGLTLARALRGSSLSDEVLKASRELATHALADG